MLEERLADEEATYARRIVETTDRLTTLSETARKIEENLDTPTEIDSVDIVPVVRRTASQIGERYPGASVTVQAPDSVTAESAPRLETAVWELLDNAANHAGEEPSITVTVRETEASTVIRVEDDGPGLPEQDRDVLLSGEETPLVHGSGLGLWLVYWVVESLDGHLTLRERETGACIEIALKRAGDP